MLYLRVDCIFDRESGVMFAPETWIPNVSSNKATNAVRVLLQCDFR
jgi:hypothetical protein